MNANSPQKSQSNMLSPSFRTDEIPPEGVSGIMTATEQERAEVARELGLANLSSLTMEYELKPIGGRRFRLKGVVKADVTQDCVVTLEPVETAIDERIEIELWPEEDLEAVERVEDEEGMALSLDGPEPFEGGLIALGQLAYEHLASALDPYPRQPGATFEWRDLHADSSSESSSKPFAELGNLMRQKSDTAR